MQRDMGYEAIANVATRLKEEATRLRNRGIIEESMAAFRAHIQWNDNGVKKNLNAPWRTFRERAEEDLDILWRRGSRELREFSFDVMREEATRMHREAGVRSPHGLDRPTLGGSAAFTPNGRWIG